jgi:hypothetical protein
MKTLRIVIFMYNQNQPYMLLTPIARELLNVKLKELKVEQ